MTTPRRLVRSLIDGFGRPSFITSVARSRSIATYAYASRPSAPLFNSLRQNVQMPLPSSRRFESTKSRFHTPLTESKELTPEEKIALEQRRSQEPAYMITFTCKPCSQRSSHRISHHGYHKGTVLIECPGCQSRHVISDHLKIFMDSSSTLEDILAKGGQTIIKAKLGGDLEWWEDGSIRSLSGGDPVQQETQADQAKESMKSDKPDSQ
ncbi:DNL zinc finger domain-containing protein [Ascosphaera apis ARSEF 7405]|uniref:DNL zinc finger domain-containing protein n=1 Tax=Ascosphaera apis ARSEF 7405 TaxID=392613 RepID=A0A167Y0Y0_9EURO|nr:DNL zinc finger domain-containing protein [Ascosphaera apis ARSEF 7405]